MITLKTLPQATAQEVFDQVAKHLLQQNKKSLVTEPGREYCVYRSDNLKCAAGCLIAEDEYSPELEGKGWNILILDNFVPSAHKSLIANLQRCHDNLEPDHWQSKLKQIAIKYGLNFNLEQYLEKQSTLEP
jgi:hypothetical protein